MSSDMTQVGPSSDPQRFRALEKANSVRLARAALKRSIQTGELTAAEVILDCPNAAASWEIAELLLSQRRWGDTRCRRFLARHQIPETKPVGQLTDRQRRMLAKALTVPAKPARQREVALV